MLVVGARLLLRNHRQRDVDDHVLLAADEPPASALHEQVAHVYFVAGRGVLGVAQEARVDAGIAERQGLAVDPHRAVLQRSDNVVGGILQLEQVAAVLDARQVGGGDECLDGAVARAGAVPGQRRVDAVDAVLDGDIDALMAAIARAGRKAKVRMGGTTAGMMPSPESVVRFFTACIAHGVTAKATAGLHHPLRGTYRLTYEPDAATGRMYGFLNVALAVAHLDTGGSAAEAIALLEEADAGRIEFSDLHVAWHGPERTLTFTRDALQHMRAQGLVSFGSCSFTEPVDESRALGWL